MTTKIFTSQKHIKQADNLLTKKMPSYRQAYSDRTAWIMACFSELAYIRFNPFFKGKHKDYFVENVSNLIGKGRVPALHKLIDLTAYDHEKEKEIMVQELDVLKFEVIETFDNDGTQAILASNGEFLCLAFRGTEATAIKDIKADATATITKCESGGKIHTGFSNAFDAVVLDIQKALSQHTGKPLFITGHSLGGALATVAAKKLQDNANIAACYTFGSPRVGNDEWLSSIKSPIYRVVNAADCVTMLPPKGEIITLLSSIFKVIAKLRVPFLSPVMMSISKLLTSKFSGYLHGGAMKYLSNCPSGNYENVKLLPSVSFWRRIKGYGIKKLGRKFLADHSISIYRKKLMVVATQRN